MITILTFSLSPASVAAEGFGLQKHMQQPSSLSKDTLKEVAVTRATVTPFWWALQVMFKVRCFTPGKTATLACISWGFGITLIKQSIGSV